MATSLTIKLGDTYPPVEAILESTISGSLAPIDLTSAEEVKFLMKKGTTLISGKCTIPAPTTGNVIYKWKTGDTSTTGDYRVEWEIHWTGGGIESVPNEGYDTISIVEDLG